MATDIGPGGYHTGTATIAQSGTVVTFQDEGNLFDIVKAGDSFGTHVGLPIRIASLDRDNAQATLAYPWPGPSQTAAPYEIAFNPYIIAYRQAVRTILDLLNSGNVAALAGLAGEADTMPYFTGPGQMGRTGLSALARNIIGHDAAADMRGDLDVAQQQQSLDDATSGRGLLAGAFGLGKEAIQVHNPNLNNFTSTGFYYLTGTKTNGPSNATLLLVHVEVSTGSERRFQIAKGVHELTTYIRYQYDGPWNDWVALTGEYGGNANGQYLRMADGTQMCWHTDTANGDGSATASVTWSYPAAFSSTPRAFANLDLGNSSIPSGSARRFDALMNNVSQSNATGLIYVMYNQPNNGPNDVFRIAMFAIGRWF